jgi:glycosyltransferase involved in cell wall biosynthesis
VSIQGNITVYKHKYFTGIETKYVKRLARQANIVSSLLFGNQFRNIYNSFNTQYKNEQCYLAKCKNIIGRTEWDKRLSIILSPNSKYYHNDEILRDSFYTKEWIPNKNSTVIIHTTTGESLYKGLETICYSLYLLNQTGHNVEWRVAGIGDNDLIVSLIKRKLKKEFPSKGLVFLGSLNESQLVRKMLEANIYVMPSHIENSPNSLCEAMILGMPCISTFAGGTGSLLHDKEDGILIQDGDPWAMAGAIMELFCDFDRAAIYGHTARQKALSRHSKEKVVRELIHIYEKIINIE